LCMRRKSVVRSAGITADNSMPFMSYVQNIDLYFCFSTRMFHIFL
jgi:hypothetical protein